MSTQHIEEADELADRVCIMSHGKVIALGTPGTIKRKFGVGYNLYVESRFGSGLEGSQLAERLVAVERVFLHRNGFEGIVKSHDSTDKKLLFLVPLSLQDRLSELIEEVERDIPEMQVDLELNSLEDAFIKIAEKDIEEEMQNNKALAQANIFMSEEEEKSAFTDYARFTGEQSTVQKMTVILLNRMRVFYRSPYQWFVLVIPLIYVLIQLFIAYSVIVTVTSDGDRENIISIFFTFYFTFFLILGNMFTAGMYAFIPMSEKKNGLRQMMHMSGLNSFEYFGGLFVGDIFLFTMPAIVISIALIGFPQIMVQEQIGDFFISFILFGVCLINFTYCFTHIFDDPDTGTKYMALIYSLGLLFGPIAISMIFAAIFGFDSSVSNAISPWYFIDPILTFAIQLYGICCRGKPDLDDFSIKIFGSLEPSLGLYCAVILTQTLIVGTINVCLDMYIRNGYRRTGGTEGEAPPLLDVRQDVLDHEQEVRTNANRLQDDDQSYQIKAIDISKTYPGANRMAVCRNTFGAHKGEVFGLLGPNGAGKSTTFNMLSLQ